MKSPWQKVCWNRSLWIREFAVAEAHRRQGISSQLLEAMAWQARQSEYRVLVVETQNTNVPAISFYQAAGFEIDGLDLSYYTNDDLARGEVAIFMKRKVESATRRMKDGF